MKACAKRMATALVWLLLCAGLPVQAQTVVKYVHTDALGSVVAVTDQSRNVIERREYEPYGAQLTPTVQDGPGYTGHVQDAATGLVYMQQRYYDPQLGVFLSVDPVTAYSDPVGMFHRYRYANNNPYTFTDPDGRCPDGPQTGTRICGGGAGNNVSVSYVNPSNGGGGRDGGSTSSESGAASVPRAAGPGSVFESRNQAQGEADAYVNDLNGGPIRGLLGGQTYLINIIELDSQNAFTYTLIPVQTGMPPAVGLRGAGLGQTLFKTGHYAARLEAAGLNVARTQTIIAREVARVRGNMAVGADVVGRMRVNGVLIEYRMQALPNGTVNVGSIFPVK